MKKVVKRIINIIIDIIVVLILAVSVLIVTLSLTSKSSGGSQPFEKRRDSQLHRNKVPASNW